MISAHRVGRKLFPQGTMMAFKGRVNSQTFEADIIEFDVRLTADKKLIILHDETFDEVTESEISGNQGLQVEYHACV